jgi:hypothetical protein
MSEKGSVGAFRRFLTIKIPTKPVALSLFAFTAIALVVVGFASMHHGPSREECERMWPGHYWADGKCRPNFHYNGGGP